MAVSDVIREWGQAMRGDWNDVDGRSVLLQMEEFAGWVDEPETYPGDKLARQSAGVCDAGGGHWCGSWYGYCDDECGCTND